VKSNALNRGCVRQVVQIRWPWSEALIRRPSPAGPESDGLPWSRAASCRLPRLKEVIFSKFRWSEKRRAGQAGGHQHMTVGLHDFREDRHMKLGWMLLNPLLSDTATSDSTMAERQLLQMNQGAGS
jgi:hypothetical protein